jgi:16S rRNA (guanine1207-N2)-methyltransferase
MNERNREFEHYFTASPKSETRYGLIRTELRGKCFEFLTASSVFSTKRIDPGTRLLIESMLLPEKGCLLDLGCGYGPLGIAAAVFNPSLHVILTDVNLRAVQLAMKNVEKNKADNAEVRRGYLYEPIKDEKMQCILSNPPVSAGMKTVKAIITEGTRVMTKGATMQLVIRSKIGAKTLPMAFKNTYENVRILDRKSGYRVLMAEKR